MDKWLYTPTIKTSWYPAVMLRHIPFYGFLLKEKLSNKKATQGQVLVYGAIEAHAMGPKGCIASNATLAQETGLGAETISNIIKQLSDGKWIKVVMKNSRTRDKIVPLWNGTLLEVPLENGIVPLENGSYYIKNTEEDKLPSAKASGFENDPKEVNALLLYFYSKILPTTPPVFSPTNRAAIDRCISFAKTDLSTGVKEVRDMIDKAEKILSQPYNSQLKVSSIAAFAQKFKLIQSHQDIKKTSQVTTSF